MTTRKKLALALGLAFVVALPAAALARHRRSAAWLKAKVSAHVDDALDAAQATREQRAKVDAARDRVFTALEEAQVGRPAQVEDALQLFSADRLDPDGIAKHRARAETSVRRIGDALARAFHDVHDTLSSTQRQQVADYVRGLLPRAGVGRQFKERFVRHLIDSRIDNALEVVRATEAQRQTVFGARDRVLAALKTNRDHEAMVEELLTIFTADRVDDARLEQLRADRLGRLRGLADAMVQALTDVHDALDAGQRKQLVDWVRTHRPRRG